MAIVKKPAKAPELISEHGKGQGGMTSPKSTKPKPKPKPKPVALGPARRAKVVELSRSLVGIREQPPGSNNGPAVRRLQSSTGAYGVAWCVSTVQFEDLQVLGSTYANKTANAFYYAQFAHDHGDVVPAPVVGAAVVYHEGAGHIGRVVQVYPGGLFDAVEGNYADSVARVRRSVHLDPCTFILRREYR